MDTSGMSPNIIPGTFRRSKDSELSLSISHMVISEKSGPVSSKFVCNSIGAIDGQPLLSTTLI